ncbi:MAG: hypothetical protein U9R17_03370 [Thermodesulfobacteriota bacterium]|nr:hypothetical protein [Thermodesulfobacteriota bacterium]
MELQFEKNRRKIPYTCTDIDYILGIPFLNGSTEQIVPKVQNGGLLVSPAAHALANLLFGKPYHEALMNADFTIPDSSRFAYTLSLKGIG